MLQPDSGKLHILLADDDSDDCMLFNEAVAQSNLPLEFTWAEDGVQLLNMLQDPENAPDVLFLDVNMPYKNGIECLQEIRSKPQFEKLPIVIYSTTNYKVNIDSCYKGGANLYVIKPNLFSDILKMVRKLCTKEWTRTFSTPPPEFFIMSTFE